MRSAALLSLSIYLACGAAVPAGTSASALQADDPLLVRTHDGWVRGFAQGGAHVFRGVPFAAPPVGALRFRPPQPVTAWEGERSAVAFASVCPQRNASSPSVGSEDCLYLNVYKPADARAGGNLPVLVFVHGAGNTATGANAGPHRDGSNLARRGAVVVTVQYRLGPFGFLTHPALTAESGSSGNYALLDQLAALRWVKRNATRFGGDPARVLLFGLSAGGLDAHALASSALSRGLFSTLAIHSGPTEYISLEAAEAKGIADAAALGCDPAGDVPACLRSRSAAEVMAARNLATERPAIDGYVLRDNPLEGLARRGTVPAIVGTVTEEQAFFENFDAAFTDDGYAASVAAAWPAIAAEVLERYPSSAYASARAAWVGAVSDQRFICAANRIARAASSGAEASPVYRFVFDHAMQNDARVSRLGAYHTLDLYFVFGNLSPIRTSVVSPFAYAPTAAETALADFMMDTWVRFAATGSPEGAGVAWPAFDPVGERHLVIGDAPGQGAHHRSGECAFWAAHGY